METDRRARALSFSAKLQPSHTAGTIAVDVRVDCRGARRHAPCNLPSALARCGASKQLWGALKAIAAGAATSKPRAGRSRQACQRRHARLGAAPHELPGPAHTPRNYRPAAEVGAWNDWARAARARACVPPAASAGAEHTQRGHSRQRWRVVEARRGRPEGHLFFAPTLAPSPRLQLPGPPWSRRGVRRQQALPLRVASMAA